MHLFCKTKNFNCLWSTLNIFITPDPWTLWGSWGYLISVSNFATQVGIKICLWNFELKICENTSYIVFNENTSYIVFNENTSYIVFNENTSYIVFNENTSYIVFNENTSYRVFNENEKFQNVQGLCGPFLSTHLSVNRCSLSCHFSL